MKKITPSVYRSYRSLPLERLAYKEVSRICTNRVLDDFLKSGYVVIKYCNLKDHAKYQLFPASPYIEQCIGHMIYSMNLKLASL